MCNGDARRAIENSHEGENIKWYVSVMSMNELSENFRIVIDYKLNAVPNESVTVSNSLSKEVFYYEENVYITLNK